MNGSTDHHRDVTLHGMDAMSLRHLLAAYHRDLGWWVEPVANGDDPDACADLRLKRDRDIVLLRCRYWGTAQRPRDAVDALVRLGNADGATGVILVDDMPFSREDIGAADRHGRVRMIDAAALHDMLGDLLPEPDRVDPFVPAMPTIDAPVTRRATRSASSGRWGWWLFAIACLLGFVLLVRLILARTADTALPPDVVASVMVNVEDVQAPMA